MYLNLPLYSYLEFQRSTSFFWSLQPSAFSSLPYRTVKTEDDVLEMDTQEQTYTITGAADDSDEE